MKVESFIAGLSLPRIVGSEKFVIAKRDLARALKTDLDAIIKSSLKGDVPPVAEQSTVAFKDIDGVKKQLHELDTAMLLSDIAPKLNQEGAGMDVGMRIVEIVSYLKSQLPQSEYELTLTGLKRVAEPSKSLDIRFLWTCKLADNPFYILKLFVDQMITAHDVKDLMAMWPQLYQEMADSFISNVIEMYPSDAVIPRKVRIPLAIFFQAPTIKLEQLAAYKEHDKKAAGDKAPQSGNSPKIAEMESK
jgi:hypothetical protein